eukprot:5107535-Karenia_brevis.AAC.1
MESLDLFSQTSNVYIECVRRFHGPLSYPSLFCEWFAYELPHTNKSHRHIKDAEEELAHRKAESTFEHSVNED